MNGWLGKLLLALGWLIVALVVLLLIVLGVSKTSWGARWLLEQSLAAVIDSPVSVRGAVEIQFWPQLSLQAHQLQAATDFADVPPACLRGRPSEDLTPWKIDAISGVWDWQQGIKGRIHVPAVTVEGIVLTEGLRGGHYRDSHAEVDLTNVVRRLVDDAAHALRSGWHLQVPAITLQKLQFQRCSLDQGLQPLYRIEQLRMALTMQSAAQATADIALDGIVLKSDALSEPLVGFVQDNGWMREGQMTLETVRSRWRVQDAMATMESLLWLGDGPSVELIAGRLDLHDGEMDVELSLQRVGGVSTLKVPGVDVILRRTNIPLRIYGHWLAPSWQLGRD